MPVRFIITTEPASKSNSSQLFTVSYRDKATGKVKYRPGITKSQKAKDYQKNAERQMPKLPALLLGPVRVSIKIFYASEVPDLDESLILDVMQGHIYKNDRQVREKHIYHGIDRENPRAVIEVEPLQGDMLFKEAA
jgi:Holliday junction resolvase RusA-like endonuclease